MLNRATEERLRAVLAELAGLREHVQTLEHDVVKLIVDLGVTWEEVGEAHEQPISRQRAAKRYSHPKPRRSTGG